MRGRLFAALAVAVPLGVTGAVAPTLVASPTAEIGGQRLVQTAEAATGDRCHYDAVYRTTGCWNWGNLPTVRPAGAAIGDYCFFIKRAISGREGTITLYKWARDANGKAYCKYYGQRTFRS